MQQLQLAIFGAAMIALVVCDCKSSRGNQKGATEYGPQLARCPATRDEARRDSAPIIRFRALHVSTLKVEDARDDLQARPRAIGRPAANRWVSVAKMADTVGPAQN
jgi:hypothetical protein